MDAVSRAADAASRTAENAYRAVGTAAKLARKDPVFIAGEGIAVAGIAAALFGLSRQRETAKAAGVLVHAAEPQVGLVPQHLEPIHGLEGGGSAYN